MLELKCVRCGKVRLRAADGAWECAGCHAAFPIVDGMPRFVSAEHYSENFGFQWNRFARTQLDSANGTTISRDTFVEKTGWSLDQLKGMRVLDAGCGMGRFAEVVADAGAELHAVDLSVAVEAAQKNLGARPGVRIYQADIMNLPFPDGSFDAIYSIGVLHHTPGTRAAFLALVPLLKPGGRIAIWVYSEKLRAMVGSEVLRKVTPRLPKRLLLRLS
jgi:2-polyprenyl-3-methyl-5-hydroxy-6-metoxy-1,4-benzoquinol methylase